MQPPQPHEHWHIDVAHINIGGTFFFLCSLLDGYSRYIVHWELRDQKLEEARARRQQNRTAAKAVA